MITYLRRLVDERNALTGVMQTMTETAAREERDLTDHERGTIAQHQERCAALDTQIGEHRAQAESARAWATLQDQLGALESEREERSGRVIVPSRVQTREEVESWGDRFVNSAEFRAYNGRGTSARVELPGLFETRAPALITTDTVDVQPYVWSGPPTPAQTTPLLDAMGKVRVSNGVVEWYGVDADVPLAAVVAEGAVKPEAETSWALNTETLVTYAHYFRITRQALEDIPQIRSILEGKLRQGIFAKIEADAIAALGAATIPPATGPDLLSAIRVGMATVQAAGYVRPISVIINPLDAASIDLAVMSTAGTGPNVLSSAWGLRFLPVGAVPQGTAYVGDVSNGLTFFDRGVTNVFVTDSHVDNFVKNILIILAEARGLPAVTEPNALAKVTVTAPPPAGTNGGSGNGGA